MRARAGALDVVGAHEVAAQLLDGGDQLRQVAAGQPVVAVQERQVLALGRVDARCCARCRDRRSCSCRHDPGAGQRCARPLPAAPGLVGGTVVHEQELEVRTGVRTQASQCVGDELLHVVERHDDGELDHPPNPRGCPGADDLATGNDRVNGTWRKPVIAARERRGPYRERSGILFTPCWPAIGADPPACFLLSWVCQQRTPGPLRVAVLADSDTRWKWGALTARRIAPGARPRRTASCCAAGPPRPPVSWPRSASAPTRCARSTAVEFLAGIDARTRRTTSSSSRCVGGTVQAAAARPDARAGERPRRAPGRRHRLRRRRLREARRRTAAAARRRPRPGQLPPRRAAFPRRVRGRRQPTPAAVTEVGAAVPRRRRRYRRRTRPVHRRLRGAALGAREPRGPRATCCDGWSSTPGCTRAREVLLKLRSKPGEHTTHIEELPYQKLVARPSTCRPTSAWCTAHMGEVLDRTDLLVTVSSTAALESLHRRHPHRGPHRPRHPRVARQPPLRRLRLPRLLGPARRRPPPRRRRGLGGPPGRRRRRPLLRRGLLRDAFARPATASPNCSASPPAAAPDPLLHAAPPHPATSPAPRPPPPRPRRQPAAGAPRPQPGRPARPSAIRPQGARGAYRHGVQRVAPVIRRMGEL